MASAGNTVDQAAGRRFLRAATGGVPGSRASGTLLTLDTLGAIAFAGGLAGAIAALGTNRPLPPATLGLALLGTALRGGVALAAGRRGAVAAREAKVRLRDRMIAAALRQMPGGGATIGTMLSTVVDEVEVIDGYVARFVPARTAATLGPLLIVGATACASPVAAGILLLTLIPFIAAMALAGGAAAHEQSRQLEALSRLSGVFADRVRALPVVLAFGAADREAVRVGRAARDVAERTLRVLAIAFLSSGALEFFAALSVALVAVYAGFDLLGLLPFRPPEHLDLARGFFVLALAPEFYLPMRRLAAAYHDRQAAEAAAARLSDFEQSAPVATLREAQTPADLLLPRSIHLRDVTIHYAGALFAAVSHFSLDVAGGETIALMGPSGSGKSSLLHMLLGRAPLSGGTVDIAGRPLDPDDLAAGASWIGQNPLILAGSLRDNLLLANPDARDEDIALALSASGLVVIVKCRGGLDARIGARGSGLSGGECRRIALARALLKPSRLLLLDEPTAHLDEASEREIIECLRELARGRTTLIATHSEALAAIADRIVHLEPVA